MGLNGDGEHLESFEDVERAFVNVRRERANDQLDVMEAIGSLIGEVSGVRRELGDVRRAIIGFSGEPRATDDTGSHFLRETYAQLKVAATDPTNPLDMRGLRTIVEDVTEEMRRRKEIGTWRKIKAFPRWAAKRAAEKAVEWAIVAMLAATAAELYHLLHK